MLPPQTRRQGICAAGRHGQQTAWQARWCKAALLKHVPNACGKPMAAHKHSTPCAAQHTHLPKTSVAHCDGHSQWLWCSSQVDGMRGCPAHQHRHCSNNARNPLWSVMCTHHRAVAGSQHSSTAPTSVVQHLLTVASQPLQEGHTVFQTGCTSVNRLNSAATAALSEPWAACSCPCCWCRWRP
jgi:hypothetical protein